MKPIEGVNLAELAAAAERERIEDLSKKVREKIAHLLSKSTETIGSISNLEKQLLKAKERLGKEQVKLTALRNGDWSVLQDDQEKKEEEDRAKQGPKED